MAEDNNRELSAELQGNGYDNNDSSNLSSPEEIQEWRKKYDELATSVQLDETTEWKNTAKAFYEVLRDITLTSVPGGKLVKGMFDLSDKRNKGLNDKKREAIIGMVLSRQQSMANALKECMVNPYGNTLLHKALAIAEDWPPQKNQLRFLSNVVHKIVSDNSDFEGQFHKHTYFLTILESLSAQALLLLSLYNKWPTEIPSDSLEIVGNQVTGDWQTDFAAEGVKSFHFGGDLVTLHDRLVHAVNELAVQRLVVVTPDTESPPPQHFSLGLTKTGWDLLQYVSDTNTSETE